MSLSANWSSFVKGEPDLKASAEPGLADDHDLSFVAGDDAVRGREAEARAVLAFGRVEGLEDALDRFGGDAAPCVRDPEAGAVEFGARAYLYVAAVRHGVHRIEEEVENDFAQLRTLAQHLNQAAALHAH